jgi:superoxide dismutase
MSSNWLDTLVKDFAKDKTSFIASVKSRIETYVKSRELECVALIEQDAYGKGRPRTHHPGLDSYMLVLGCFLTKSDYKGHTVESALSQPVAEIVGDEYMKYFTSKSDEIVERFQQHLAEDKIMLDSICESVSQKISETNATWFGKSQLTKVLRFAISHAATSATGQAIATQATAGISAAAAKIMALHISPLVWKMAALQLKVIVGKIVASAAFKTAVHSATGKQVALITVTVMTKMLATKYFAAHAALVGNLILGGVVAGIFLVELSTMSSSMGKKIAEKVGDTLDKEFEQTNTMVLEKMKNELPGALSDALAKALGESQEFKHGLTKLKNLEMGQTTEATERLGHWKDL